MSDALDNETHERFAVAYATLERISPGKSGNASTAYLTARPSASKKTAENQATNLLKRPEVIHRVEGLLGDGGVDDLVRSEAYINDLAYRAAELAKQEKDATTMLRAAEMLDRGRQGGPIWIKETRSRRVAESPFSGKSPKEIAAMKQAALAQLGVPEALADTSAIQEFLEWKNAKQIEVGDAEGESARHEQGAGAGDPDRPGEPVH